MFINEALFEVNCNVYFMYVGPWYMVDSHLYDGRSMAEAQTA